MQANVDIVLTGTRGSVNYTLPDGIGNIGGKGIGVYGGLDLHGKKRLPTWTKLNSTANIGSRIIVLTEPVDWKAGESIVITTTSTQANRSEEVVIASKSSDNRTLTLTTALNYTHICVQETGALVYSICAAVGLLTRNIRVIGHEYAAQNDELYGFRIIVSDYSAPNVDGVLNYYKGYIRVNDVEFVRAGQFSRASGDDNKYGILMSNLGNQNWSRPSYVNNSAFHDGFAAAVCTLNTNGVPITNNVVYKSVEYGLRIEGNSNYVVNNLVAMIYWASSLITYEAKFDMFSFGAIDVRASDSIILERNYIAGAERVGFWIRG